MAQQTAVEWLINHWKKLQSEGEKMSWQQIIDITELAKQMEREQIEDAYMEGAEKQSLYPSKSAVNYYNETYGK